jgi:hypothetical protein
MQMLGRGLTEVSVGFCKALTEATVGVFKIAVVFGDGLIGVADRLLLMYQAKTEVLAERVGRGGIPRPRLGKRQDRLRGGGISIRATKAQKPQRPIGA